MPNETDLNGGGEGFKSSRPDNSNDAESHHNDGELTPPHEARCDEGAGEVPAAPVCGIRPPNWLPTVPGSGIVCGLPAGHLGRHETSGNPSVYWGASEDPEVAFEYGSPARPAPNLSRLAKGEETLADYEARALQQAQGISERMTNADYERLTLPLPGKVIDTVRFTGCGGPLPLNVGRFAGRVCGWVRPADMGGNPFYCSKECAEKASASAQVQVPARDDDPLGAIPTYVDTDDTEPLKRLGLRVVWQHGVPCCKVCGRRDNVPLELDPANVNRRCACGNVTSYRVALYYTTADRDLERAAAAHHKREADKARATTEHSAHQLGMRHAREWDNLMTGALNGVTDVRAKARLMRVIAEAHEVCIRQSVELSEDTVRAYDREVKLAQDAGAVPEHIPHEHAGPHRLPAPAPAKYAAHLSADMLLSGDPLRLCNSLWQGERGTEAGGILVELLKLWQGHAGQDGRREHRRLLCDLLLALGAPRTASA